MKYVVVIPDGASDHPIPELDGRTPLQAARTPNYDWLAERGRVGVSHVIPPGMYPGSDVGNLAIFGYDPRKYYTGRGPIEAASQGIPVNSRDVVFRCNLVSTDGETLLDYSAGHVSTEEGRALIELVNERLGGRRFSFYPGISYRHLMVWRDGTAEQKTVPPHDIAGQALAPHLPSGEGEAALQGLIWDSLELLDGHEINRRRRDAGRPPANLIWLWGQGRSPSVPLFSARRGITGAVVAEVDLIRGLARLAGLRLIDVPGMTGYLDTNFKGMAEGALAALQDDDLVIVHVEAADEAGHNGDLDAKIQAIERIDQDVIGTLRDGLATLEGGWRLLSLPDHPTPIELRTHAHEPVPFLLYDSTHTATGPRLPFDERALNESKLVVEDGFRTIDLLLEEA